MTVDYGKVFSQWRDVCPEIWSAYTHHAFVAGLGDGTMPSSDIFAKIMCFLFIFRAPGRLP